MYMTTDKRSQSSVSQSTVCSRAPLQLSPQANCLSRPFIRSQDQSNVVELLAPFSHHNLLHEDM